MPPICDGCLRCSADGGAGGYDLCADCYHEREKNLGDWGAAIDHINDE
jgi:hypothetical protein